MENMTPERREELMQMCDAFYTSLDALQANGAEAFITTLSLVVGILSTLQERGGEGIGLHCKNEMIRVLDEHFPSVISTLD